MTMKTALVKSGYQIAFKLFVYFYHLRYTDGCNAVDTSQNFGIVC